MPLKKKGLLTVSPSQIVVQIKWLDSCKTPTDLCMSGLDWLFHSSSLPILKFYGISQNSRTPYATQHFEKEERVAIKSLESVCNLPQGQSWASAQFMGLSTELQFLNISVSANSVTSKDWVYMNSSNLSQDGKILSDSREPPPKSCGSRTWPHGFPALKVDRIKEPDCTGLVKFPHLS